MAPNRLPLFLNTITLPLLLLLLHQPLITTASPLSPISLFVNTNTTTPAVSAASNDIQCVESSDWVTSRFFAYDCFSAIGLFQEKEVNRHPSTLYEFLAADLTPLYPQFTQHTPRKYTYNSCTMAIVMLDDLPHGLPGLPPPAERWALTDMCDYVSIETAVLNVRDGCLSVVLDPDGDGDTGKGKGRGKRGTGPGGVGFANPVGYDTVGMHGAIGVFLWDTNSVINHAVQEWVVEFGIGNGNLTAGASGSGSGSGSGGTRVVGS